jgi:hypothetical protein
VRFLARNAAVRNNFTGGAFLEFDLVGLRGAARGTVQHVHVSILAALWICIHCDEICYVNEGLCGWRVERGEWRAAGDVGTGEKIKMAGTDSIEATQWCGAVRQSGSRIAAPSIKPQWLKVADYIIQDSRRPG